MFFSRIISKILGGQLLRDISAFVAALDTMFGGFRERATATYELLRRPGTWFVVVASPEPDALREASYFVDRLSAEGMPLAGLVLNRTHPPATTALSATRAEGAAEEVAESGADGADVAAAALRVHAERMVAGRPRAAPGRPVHQRPPGGRRPHRPGRRRRRARPRRAARHGRRADRRRTRTRRPARRAPGCFPRAAADLGGPAPPATYPRRRCRRTRSPEASCSPSSPRRSSSPARCWPGCCSRGSAAAGLVARNSASLLDALPVELTDKTPAGNSRVLAADGSLITNFFTNNRTPVAPDQISAGHEAGAGRHRGLAVLRAQRPRRAGHAARPGARTWPPARCRRAARRSPSSWSSRRCCRRRPRRRSSRRPKEQTRRPQAQGGPARPGAGADLLQGRDPHPLPEHRVLRGGRLRHPGRRPEVLQRQRRRPDPAAGGRCSPAWCRARPTTTRSPSPRTPRTGATRCCSGCTRSSTSPTRSWPTISAQPVAVVAGRRPAERLHRRRAGRVLLRLPLQLPHRHARPEPGRQSRTAADDPDDAAAGSAALGGPGACWTTSPMGDPLAGVLDAVQPGTGHVLAMSVNRRLRLHRPRLRVGEPERGAAAGRRIHVQGLHRRGRALGGLRRELHAERAAALHLPGLQEERRHARVRPTSSATTTPATRRRYNMTTGLIASANTYFVGLEDALGSVEGPVQDRRGHGHALRRPGQPAPGRVLHRQPAAARSRSGRTRPARWTSPAPTRPSPPAARTATPRR